MFHYVHSSLIYYTQKLDRTQMSLNRRMDAEKCGYRMEYNSEIKNNDFIQFTGQWMELENVILTEVTQTKKGTHICVY